MAATAGQPLGARVTSSHVSFRARTHAPRLLRHTQDACHSSFPIIQDRRLAAQSLHGLSCWIPRHASMVRTHAVADSGTTADAQPSSTSAVAEDVKGEMLKPSAANKNWVRLATFAGILLLASRGSPFLPARLLGFLHIGAFGVWLGANFWTTFIAGFTMFKNLPRQTFGKLQSKLFPPYFALNTLCPAILLGTLAAAPAGVPRLPLIALVVGLVGSLLNWVWVEPVGTAVMLKRYDLENATSRDDARIKELYKEFGKWHGLSSVLNLGVFAGVIAHGWWLAGRMIVPL